MKRHDAKTLGVARTVLTLVIVACLAAEGTDPGAWEQAELLKIRDLIKAGKLDEAWKRSESLASSGLVNGEDMALVAQIALADPNVRKNGPARLATIKKRLTECTQELEMAETGRKGWYKDSYPALVRSFYLASSLALVCDDAAAARSLLIVASEWATRLPIPEYRLPPGAIVELPAPRRDVLLTLMQRLIAFGEHERALAVLQSQWLLLGYRVALPPDAEKDRATVIKGLACAELARILAAQGDDANTARYYDRALKLLAQAPIPEAVKVCDEAKRRLRWTNHACWASGAESPVPRLSSADLSKELLLSLNEFTKALVKGDVDRAATYVASGATQKPKLRDLADLLKKKGIIEMRHSDIGGIGAHPATATRISVTCSLTVTRAGGGQKSGPSAYVFVREKDAWKIDISLLRDNAEKNDK